MKDYVCPVAMFTEAIQDKLDTNPKCFEAPVLLRIPLLLHERPSSVFRLACLQRALKRQVFSLGGVAWSVRSLVRGPKEYTYVVLCSLFGLVDLALEEP